MSQKKSIDEQIKDACSAKRFEEAFEAMKAGEQKKPQAGEWWFSGDMKHRMLCHGEAQQGRVIMEDHTGEVDAYERLNKSWHHKPLCTGWDWQPEPEPEWFDLTPFDGHQMRVQTDYAYYLPHDQSGEWKHTSALFSVSTVGELKKLGYTQFRCLIKDAPKIVKTCNGCGKPLLPENAWMTDGCPCNSPAGVNSEHSSSVEVYHRYVTPFGEEFWVRNTGETREVVR